MALSTIDQFQLTLSLQWNVTKTRTGLQPLRNQENQQHRQTYTLGVGAGAINELVAYVHTVTAGATVDIDMSAALTNVVNDLAITLARVKVFFAKLLSASDTDADGNVIGNACSGVTLGGDAANWLFLTDPSDKVRINNGDMLLLTRKDATGLVVTGTTADILQVQNHDGAVDAKLLLILGGAAT
jgi:hypothetical protein